MLNVLDKVPHPRSRASQPVPGPRPAAREAAPGQLRGSDQRFREVPQPVSGPNQGASRPQPTFSQANCHPSPGALNVVDKVPRPPLEGLPTGFRSAPSGRRDDSRPALRPRSTLSRGSLTAFRAEPGSSEATVNVFMPPPTPRRGALNVLDKVPHPRSKDSQPLPGLHPAPARQLPASFEAAANVSAGLLPPGPSVLNVSEKVPHPPAGGCLATPKTVPTVPWAGSGAFAPAEIAFRTNGTDFPAAPGLSGRRPEAASVPLGAEAKRVPSPRGAHRARPLLTSWHLTPDT